MRDDGVSYGDYLEQLTYLIFLDMSDGYSTPLIKRTWQDMNTLIGADLENQYKGTPEKLGEQDGLLERILY